MQLFTWLSKCITGATQTRRAPARKPTPCFRPRLETLEGRDVPSTLTVTSAADSGAGSLRADIAAANPGDTINFAPSLNGQTITLTGGQLLIGKSLSIQGPGASQLAISGGNTSRVFEVIDSNVNVLLSGLTITRGNGRGGYNVDGGGILNTGGSTLTISGCTLCNNRADCGGGVANEGATLHLVNSTLSGNKAFDLNGLGKGGGLYSWNSHTNSTVIGCTFSNNTAQESGGGMYIISTTMTISGCTFSGNVEYNSGAGTYSNDIHIFNGDPASMLTVSDSVFSNNTPYYFLPIIGPRTNGGGNTFNYN